MTEENEPLLTPLQKAYLDANPDVSLAEDAPETSSEKKPLKGVGGWLSFLVVSLFALGPIFGFILNFGEIARTEDQFPDLIGSDLWGRLKAVMWTFFAVQVAISVYAAHRLNNRLVPASVPIAIFCLWLSGPILNFLAALVVGNMNGESIVGSNEVATGIFRSGLTATIWTAYLLLSRRVKNTYRGVNYERVSIAARWRKLDRKRRQFVFFAFCWVVLTFLYYSFVSPPDSYADEQGPNMWAIIFLPPMVLGIGWWAYNKFVGSNDA